MKRRACLLALIALLLITSGVAAKVASYEVPRFVISSGGGHVAAGSFALDGTIGQAVVGTVSMGSYQLCSGFWCGLGIYQTLLPLILR